MTAVGYAPELLPERESAISKTAVVLFIWLLPFHAVSMAYLVGGIGLPFTTVRALASWKEIAVVWLLTWAAARALLARGPDARIAPPDMAVASMVAFGAVFLAAENTVFAADIPRTAALYGFREAVFFMLLYFVGRAAPRLCTRDWVLKHLFAIGMVVSAIALLERLLVSPEMLVLIGVATYMNDFLGLSAFTAGNEWGLPQNYWTMIGDVPVRRAGSVFLHSQGLALPFLLLMPAATALITGRRGGGAVLLRLGYGFLWVGLLLTLTRLTIVVCVIQVALYFVLVRRPEWAAGTVVSWLAAFGVALLFLPGLAIFVWETLTWQTPSSVSHAGEWTKGAVALFEKPWGHGLGTTEAVAARAGLTPITGDNMYLSYAVQLGVVGLAVHLSALLLVLSYAYRTFRIAVDPSVGRFAAVVGLCTVGILLNGATSLVFSSTFLAYVYFLLAGALVTTAQQQEQLALRT